MREDAVAESRVGEATHHGDFDCGHHLSAFETKDCRPENLAGLRVYDRFHKSTRLVHFKGTRDVRHRLFGNAYFTLLLAGLRFTEANAPKLRIRENVVGNQAAIGCG